MKKQVVAIIGSANENSTNLKLVEYISEQTKGLFDLFIFNDLKSLPHFDPDDSAINPPLEVVAFRNLIEQSAAVIICTPEYVFSIPSGLKNAIEWCVATTVFSGKLTGLITASANGEKAQDELHLIMQTLMANISPETTLLIKGIKGKVNDWGQIKDAVLKSEINNFIIAFDSILNKN